MYDVPGKTGYNWVARGHLTTKGFKCVGRGRPAHLVCSKEFGDYAAKYHERRSIREGRLGKVVRVDVEPLLHAELRDEAHREGVPLSHYIESILRARYTP